MPEPTLLIVISDILNITIFSFTIGLGIVSHINHKKETIKPNGDIEKISDFRRYRMASIFIAPLVGIVGLSMHQLLS